MPTLYMVTLRREDKKLVSVHKIDEFGNGIRCRRVRDAIDPLFDGKLISLQIDSDGYDRIRLAFEEGIKYADSQGFLDRT